MQMEFEKLLAFFCAPALAGIKPSNLVSCSREEYPELETLAAEYDRAFRPAGIRIRMLCGCGQRSLLLVYRTESLRCQLAKPEVSTLLAKAGYPVRQGLEPMLDVLACRFSEKGDFPHEVGLFLGYPAEDVLGFCRHSGRNFRCCGYWKVYGDAERARRTFAEYDRCREAACRKICAGESLVRLFSA